ncbi:hypothetical protein V6Z77_009848 [Aspergillus fumigatus]
MRSHCRLLLLPRNPTAKTVFRSVHNATEEMEDAATQITEDEMAVARMLDGSVGIMTLAAMTGIGTGASALRKTIAVTQTIGTTTGVADVIGTGGAIIIILTVTGIGEVVHAKDIRF